jgi:hypothetical protein
MIEESALRRIFGPKREAAWWGFRKNCVMRNFITCMLHPVLLV